MFGDRETTETELERAKLPYGQEVDGSFYDETYYVGKDKSNWGKPFEWKNWSEFYLNIAEMLAQGFPSPYVQSMIDVGCARGFMMAAFGWTWIENEWPIKLAGFDISKWAVDNAVFGTEKFMVNAGVDDYQFSTDHDLMLCMDVLEHLTPEQTKSFLERSRQYINHSVFAVIPLPGDPDAENEPSHVNRDKDGNLHDREWWNQTFIDAGWHLTQSCIDQTKLAMEHNAAKSAKWNVFIFRANEDV